MTLDDTRAAGLLVPQWLPDPSQATVTLQSASYSGFSQQHIGRGARRSVVALLRVPSLTDCHSV